MNQEIKLQRQSENAQDLFTYLPSEIMLNILLRIPTLTVMSCKCVCKAWRDLLETPEFVKSHLSNSVPGLAVYLRGQIFLKRYNIVEFVDGNRLNIVLSFDLPLISEWIIYISANGLLFVYFYPRCDLIICNPITREYIRLPSPLEPSPRPTYYNSLNYGFGVSKMSGRYKVVRILNVVDCQVYTVGSGSWRRIASDDEVHYEIDANGAFLNRNLHWLAHKKGSSDHDLICCLDLETERFGTFSPPPRHYPNRTLSVLGDYLCVCDTFVESCGVVSGIDIWLMKEYGDEESWAKEFHIYTGYRDGFQCPIKVFENGDMLIEWGCSKLLYYSSKPKTIREVDLSKDDPIIDIPRSLPHMTFFTVYAPSFLSLKTFAMETVTSF